MSPTAAGGAPRKLTKQQAAVAAALEQLEEFTSAQELHVRLRAEGSSVGLATVYRALQTMAAEGSIDQLRTADGEVAYRRCSTGHHHHLVCRDCGRTVEVAGPAVEQWAAQISTAHGYTEVTHTMEIFGTCPECR